MLTLVRHGEPERNVGESERADPPLSRTGWAQMTGARRLVEVDGCDALFCSPLRRARESAEVLLPGCCPVIDDDLAEFDRDTQRYVHWEDGVDPYRAYLAGDLSPWGTTLDEFRGRIRAAVERMRVAGVEHAVAVTHGGVINNFLAMVLGLSRTSVFRPGYGSVNRFRYLPGWGWVTVELNAIGARISTFQELSDRVVVVGTAGRRRSATWNSPSSGTPSATGGRAMTLG